LSENQDREKDSEDCRPSNQAIQVDGIIQLKGELEHVPIWKKWVSRVGGRIEGSAAGYVDGYLE
jgi:hypothetical protein